MKRIDRSTISVVIVLALTAVASFIGEGCCFEGSTQAWVGALIGAAVSIASSIAGSAMANKAQKQKASAYDQAWGEYEDWYEGQMNASILDRADTLSMLKRYRDWQEEEAKKYQTNAIKGGASEEAKIAYAQKANKGYADAISRIAAMGQQYKDRLSQGFMQQQLGYKQKRADLTAEGAQTVANGIANAGGAIGDLVGGMNWGGKKKLSPGPNYEPSMEDDWLIDALSEDYNN